MSSLHSYLGRLATRYPLLKPEEEIELARAIRCWQDYPGGPDQAPAAIRRAGLKAQDRFMLANIRLAHWVAGRFSGRGVSPEDLLQSACEGLLQAVRRFDPGQGCRFSSYAVWWLQQACQSGVAAQGPGLRLPTTVSESLRRVSRAGSRLQMELNRFPTEAELEAGAKLKAGQLRQLRIAARITDTRSLDEHLGRNEEGSEGSWIDLLADDEQPGLDLERRDLRRSLLQLIETCPTLTPQQRHILHSRYLCEKPLSLVAVASQLHLSRETCRRLEQGALAVLKARGLRMRVYL